MALVSGACLVTLPTFEPGAALRMLATERCTLISGNDTIFQMAFRNTVFYTFWATIFKLALGMWLALLLNRSFRFKRIVRASMLLPFIIPTVLSAFAWRSFRAVQIAR